MRSRLVSFIVEETKNKRMGIPNFLPLALAPPYSRSSSLRGTTIQSSDCDSMTRGRFFFVELFSSAFCIAYVFLTVLNVALAPPFSFYFPTQHKHTHLHARSYAKAPNPGPLSFLSFQVNLLTKPVCLLFQLYRYHSHRDQFLLGRPESSCQARAILQQRSKVKLQLTQQGCIMVIVNRLLHTQERHNPCFLFTLCSTKESFLLKGLLSISVSQ